MMHTDVVIGLEVHVELDTMTKLFCSCPTKGSESPNTRCCDVCLGMPGSKPVLNSKALEYALRLCLALKCNVSKELVFSRKSYFYPDMAKNYQISQYELPLGAKGSLTLGAKAVNIKRVHMEEDPAALTHPSGMHTSSFVLVDYNRSGNPLVEVVTEPDLASPDEAREFMKKLITILSYLGIFDVKQGIIKADANVSIKAGNYQRVEVKNITGFKDIERALQHEVERQKREVKEGKKIMAETRSWDSDVGITRSLRLKETEEEYGYIFDPDLVLIDITPEMIAKIQSSMPELAEQRVVRYINEWKIAPIDAEVIASDKLLSDIFEHVASHVDKPYAAKWIRRELIRVLNYQGKEMPQNPIRAEELIMLITLLQQKKITENTGQKIMELLMEGPFNIVEYVRKNNLEAVSDTGVLERLCREAIAEHPAAVEDFRSGSDKSLNFLVGKVMAKSKGKASPKEVNEIIKKLVR